MNNKSYKEQMEEYGYFELSDGVYLLTKENMIACTDQEEANEIIDFNACNFWIHDNTGYCDGFDDLEGVIANCVENDIDTDVITKLEEAAYPWKEYNGHEYRVRKLEIKFIREEERLGFTDNSNAGKYAFDMDDPYAKQYAYSYAGLQAWFDTKEEAEETVKSAIDSYNDDDW